MTTFRCTALHYITLHNFTLHHATLNNTTIHHTKLHYTMSAMLHFTTPHCTTRRCIAKHCTASLNVFIQEKQTSDVCICVHSRKANIGCLHMCSFKKSKHRMSAYVFIREKQTSDVCICVHSRKANIGCLHMRSFKKSKHRMSAYVFIQEKQTSDVCICVHSRKANNHFDAGTHSNRISYLYHSLADRGGTTVDFATSFLHSLRFSAYRSSIFHSRPVHSLMLSSHRFLCLPLRLAP